MCVLVDTFFCLLVDVYMYFLCLAFLSFKPNHFLLLSFKDILGIEKVTRPKTKNFNL